MTLTSYINRYQVALQRIYRSVNNMMKEHVHSDITTEQFSVLQFIATNEKVTSTQIAQSMGVGKSAITAIVNRLVQKKLVERTRNKEDRRIVHLSLSDEGIYIVKKTEKAINQFIEDKLAHFAIEDIKKFLLSIEQLSELMEKDGGTST